MSLSKSKQIFLQLLRNLYNDGRRNVHGTLQNCQKKVNCDKKTNYMNPECKVALVTGGAEGIGFSIANHLLKAGAKAVAITGLNTCRGKEAVNCLNNAYGRNRSMFINSNSNCMVQLEETFKVVHETYKQIDIVVNSAGICDGPRWESEIVTNIIGTVRTTLLAYKYVGLEGCGKGGVVVNLSGIRMPSLPSLSACFSGIVGLTRSFGHEHHRERSGVRIVGLCTGLTSTDFFKGGKDRGMTDYLNNELIAVLKNGNKQGPDVAGCAALHLIEHGESGSIWALEGSRLFICRHPKWEQISTMEAQYL